MSRANQLEPMRNSLSARTGSQSEASKKRGPDEYKRRVSARTSGKSESSLPTIDGARRRLREFSASSSAYRPEIDDERRLGEPPKSVRE
ncbi:hypothetical protein TSAR_006753 [Trichomalopsis sarcophagae]|uniref:Uncharacterized protein n=1 Tax=Trichomalopsis sarcophagae TaxID=543379 RepID=A0A232EUD9_9HYME|nr:hypothetical protein TSAR_006753 [Trichomalopsis sarcophagae]